jgi:maltose operon protein
MKMKKSLVALCLSAGLLASVPAVTFADVNFVPQNTSAAPAIPAAALQQLTWTPVDQSKVQSTQLCGRPTAECAGDYRPGCRL